MPGLKDLGPSFPRLLKLINLTVKAAPALADFKRIRGFIDRVMHRGCLICGCVVGIGLSCTSRP